jgi:hypothetical protein
LRAPPKHFFQITKVQKKQKMKKTIKRWKEREENNLRVSEFAQKVVSSFFKLHIERKHSWIKQLNEKTFKQEEEE